MTDSKDADVAVRRAEIGDAAALAGGHSRNALRGGAMDRATPPFGEVALVSSPAFSRAGRDRC